MKLDTSCSSDRAVISSALVWAVVFGSVFNIGSFFLFEVRSEIMFVLPYPVIFGALMYAVRYRIPSRNASSYTGAPHQPW